MSFIAKNPLIIPEIKSPPLVPRHGTRGLFAGEDGWYDLNSENVAKKLITSEDIVDTAPYIGENGNWFVFDTETNTYVDTGIKAQGGESGDGESLAMLNSLKYYGDMDIVPSEAELFEFVTDDTTMTASVSAKTSEISGNIVIPYEYIVDSKRYSVTSIDDSAFCDCYILKSVTIPDSVTSIGNYAFAGCNKITNIAIPEGVAYIGAMAFTNCASLTNVILKDGVTEIGSTAFAHCSSLTSITIPNSVTTINPNAFFDCMSLTEVYYEGTKEQFESINIDGNNDSLSGVTVHYEQIPTTKGYVDEALEKAKDEIIDDVVDALPRYRDEVVTND